MAVADLLESHPGVVVARASAGVVVARASDVGIILWHGEPTVGANHWVIGHVVAAQRAGHPMRVGLQLNCES